MNHTHRPGAWRQIRAILLPLLLPTRDQVNRPLLAGLLLVLPALVLGIRVLQAVFLDWELTWWDPVEALAAGLFGSAALLLITSFSLMINWLSWQFSPTNATLLPGLRRRLPWAGAVLVLGPPLVIAALILLDKQAPVLALGWLTGVVFLLGMVVSLRSAPVSFGLMALALGLFFWGAGDPAGQLPWRWLALPWLAVPLGLLLTAGLLRWVFALRGDRHQRYWLATTRQAKLSGDASLADDSGWVGPRWFALYLASRCRAGGRPVRTLFCAATGPQLHWTSNLNSFVGLMLLMVVMLESQQLFAEPHVVLMALPMFLLPFPALIAVMYPIIAPRLIWQTRTEQALLTLAERAPDKAQQTRLLLRYLVWQALLRWGLALLLALAVGERYGLEFLQPLHVCTVGLSLLPGMAWVVGNYAVLSVVTGPNYLGGLLGWVLLNLALSAVAVGLLFNAPDRHAWLWCVTMGASALLIIGWRWRQALRVAHMFPAGRAV